LTTLTDIVDVRFVVARHVTRHVAPTYYAIGNASVSWAATPAGFADEQSRVAGESFCVKAIEKLCVTNPLYPDHRSTAGDVTATSVLCHVVDQNVHWTLQSLLLTALRQTVLSYQKNKEKQHCKLTLSDSCSCLLFFNDANNISELCKFLANILSTLCFASLSFVQGVRSSGFS